MSHTGNTEPVAEQSTGDACPRINIYKIEEEIQKKILAVNEEIKNTTLGGSPIPNPTWKRDQDERNKGVREMSVRSMYDKIEKARALRDELKAEYGATHIFTIVDTLEVKGIYLEGEIKITVELKNPTFWDRCMRKISGVKEIQIGGSNKITFYKNDKRYTRVVQTNKRGTKCVKFEGKLVPVSKLKLKK
jgi:hypothetical protein